MAAEMAHCYLGEAPADAPMTTQSPAPFSGFQPDLQLAAARTACNHDTAPDRTYIDARVARAQCSSQSEIAGYVQNILSVDQAALATEMKNMMGLDDDRFRVLCAQLETCAPNAETGYADACNASMKAAAK